jgi:hypothetical protein
VIDRSTGANDGHMTVPKPKKLPNGKWRQLLESLDATPQAFAITHAGDEEWRRPDFSQATIPHSILHASPAVLALPLLTIDTKR